MPEMTELRSSAWRLNAALDKALMSSQTASGRPASINRTSGISSQPPARLVAAVDFISVSVVMVCPRDAQSAQCIEGQLPVRTVGQSPPLRQSRRLIGHNRALSGTSADL